MKLEGFHLIEGPHQSTKIGKGPVSVHILSESEKDRLLTLVLSCLHCEDNDPAPFLEIAQSLAPILIPEFFGVIGQLKLQKIDAVFLKNLPDFHMSAGAEEKTKALSMLLACMLGNPFQYAQQNQGEVVAKVTPESGFENSHSSSGRMKFGWHSDDSFLDERFRTDFILLSGFYNPSQVGTRISSVEEMVNRLRSEELMELMKSKFTVGVPTSFRSHQNCLLNKVPAIWKDGFRKLNIAISDYNATSDEKGMNALTRLFQAAEESAVTFNLQPGTALIFNNNRFLHSRGEIIGDRTVFRVYIKESLKYFRKLSLVGNVFDLNKIMNEVIGEETRASCQI